MPRSPLQPHNFPQSLYTLLDQYESGGPFELGPLPASRATGLMIQFRRLKRALNDSLRDHYQKEYEEYANLISSIYLTTRSDPIDSTKAFLQFQPDPVLSFNITPLTLK